MITPVTKLEKIGPNLGFSSLPNLEEAWNLYFASASISHSYQGMTVSVFWSGPLEVGGLCINNKISAEARIRDWLTPQALQLPSAKYSSMKEYISGQQGTETF